jgi:hypothetical protein
MEKIMSKSNDTTKTRELTEAELVAVSGGLMPEHDVIWYGVIPSGTGTGFIALSPQGPGSEGFRS